MSSNLLISQFSPPILALSLQRPERRVLLIVDPGWKSLTDENTIHIAATSGVVRFTASWSITASNRSVALMSPAAAGVDKATDFSRRVVAVFKLLALVACAVASVAGAALSRRDESADEGESQKNGHRLHDGESAS